MTASLLDAANVRALVDAAKTGDRQAFAALYTKYQPLVWRYIARRVRPRETADDLTQDVFRRALTAIARYEHRGVDLGAWFMTMSRNIVADHFKSGPSRLLVSAGTDEYFDGQVDDDQWVSPETRAVYVDDKAALGAAIARLNDDQRTCIRLRFLCGYTVAETAVAMGRNEGAVKALQYRATGALRRDPAVEALR